MAIRGIPALAGTAIGLGMACAAHAQLDIHRAAPEDALLVIRVADMEQAWARFQASPLGEMYEDDEAREFVEFLMEEPRDAMLGQLEKLDLEADDLPMPESAGMAIWMPGVSGLLSGQMDLDAWEEITPESLICLEFGPRAGEFQDVLDRLIEHGEDEGLLEVSYEDFGPWEIVSLTSIEQEDADDEWEEDWEDGLPDLGPLNLAELFSEEGTAIVRVDSGYLISQQADTLRDAVDRHEDGAGVGDSAEYRAGLATLPETADVTAVLRADTMMGLMTERMAMDEGPDGMDVSPEPLMEALGLLDLGPAALSLSFDTPDAGMELAMGALIEGRRGLWSLMPEENGAYEPPSFIGADASSASRVRMDFDLIYPLLTSLSDRVPEPVRPQYSMWLEQGRAIAEPVLNAIGPDLHVYSSIRRPLGAGSERQIFALQLRDGLVVNNTIAMVAPMAQMTGRSFEGSQLYEQEDAGMAVGVGSGWLFVGPPEGVEDALRREAAGAGAALAEEPGFRRAMDAIEGNGPVTTYTNTRLQMEMLYHTIENYEEVMLAMFEGSGMDVDQLREFGMLDRPEWMDRVPPVELVLEHMGDSAGEVRWVEDGMRGRFLWLRAED